MPRGPATQLFGLALLCACSAEYRFDYDRDGWEDMEDCDPSDPSIHPDADDAVGDGIDQDCDGADGTAVPAVAIYPPSPRTTDQLLLQVVTEAPAWEVSWSLDGEPQPAWDGQTFILAELTERGQVWRASVTTLTSAGTETATASVDVTIANTPPTASLVVGLDPLVAEGDVLAVGIGTDDPDDDLVSLAWSWRVDGEPIADQDGPQLSSAFFDKGQTVEVAVTPDDGIDSGATLLSNAALVVNTPPALQGVTLDPPTGTVQTLFTCVPIGWSDPDPADPESIQFEWYVGGELTGTDDQLAAPEFSKHDVVQCRATPVDDEAAGAMEIGPQIVIDNAPPVVSAASLEPIDPTEATTLSIAGIGFSDADGDPEDYLADWYVDNVLVATNSATLPPTLFDKGDVVHAEVRPWDGESLGDPVLTGSLTILNTTPAVASVAILPAVAYHGDVLTAVPTGYDDPDPADVEGYQVQWFVDGLPTGPDDLELPASFFARDAVVTVELTPDDGEATGPPTTSAPLTISNTPPTVAAVSISPLEPRTGDTLTAVPVGWSDPDPADSEGYVFAWTVGGLPAGANSPELDPAAFAKGDEVTVTITPDDGTDPGATVASPTAVIVNTPPGAPVVQITPALPLNTDELLCEVPVDAVDADGDPLEYDFLWIEDGFGTPYTTPTLPVEQTDWFEVWECVVTADDGDEPGEAGSAEVEIGQNCDIDEDLGVAEVCGGDDCDDDDPLVFAAQTETCNGIDDDCDGYADQDAGCPCDVAYREEHSYLLCGSDLSWGDSRDACLAVGYDLVTIEDSSEGSWLRDEVSLYPPQPHALIPANQWWIGLNDQTEEGTLEWASGAEVTYVAWDGGGGGYNHAGSDCAGLATHASGPIWPWTSCGTARRYVCENLP